MMASRCTTGTCVAGSPIDGANLEIQRDVIILTIALMPAREVLECEGGLSLTSRNTITFYRNFYTKLLESL